MAKTNNRASFSFALSETPPPVREVAGGSLGDLDLDLDEFREVPLRVEPDSEPEAQEAQEASRDFAGSHFTPRIENPLLGAEFGAQQAEHQETPILQPFALSPVAPQVQATQVEVLQKSALVAAPSVKKIQFPQAQATGAKKPEGSLKSSVENKSERDTTRFSRSIAAEGPRGRLGSDPEVLSSGATRSETSEAAELLSSVPPEDLPVALKRGRHDQPSWDAETPTAREIWKRARKAWGATSRQAVALGGQGLRVGRQLAKETNDRLRERLERTDVEREEGASIAPTNEGASSCPGQVPSVSSIGASVTGRVILGLSGATTKRLAAPLSAIAAAGLVYLGGTALLGTTGAIALSKPATAAKIPDLGTIGPEAAALQDPEQREAEGTSVDGQEPRLETSLESAGGKPAAMQVEQVEMPEGLSWPGKGLIEVVTSEEELIYVDGVFTGRGPLRRIPVSPGEHEVSIRSGGLQRTGKVHVKENKNTRAVFTVH